MSSECDEIKSALDVIGDRWSAVILWAVRDQPKRFVEIQKDTEGINSRTLTQRLQDLENSELIVRQEFKEYPPRTEYSITEKGKDLMPVIDSMRSWSEKYIKASD